MNDSAMLGSGGNPTAASQLDIPSAFDDLYRQMEILGKSVDQLAGRLDSVMVPNGPATAEQAGKVANPIRSAVAARTRDAAENIRRIRGTIDNLISRVQV